jgi:DNA-binding NarL/FixJ family response regulator
VDIALLMDPQVPQMSGLDAIIAIRGALPDARIIVLTTPRALDAGARAYLLKYAVDVALLDTIQAVHAGAGHGVLRQAEHAGLGPPGV